MAVLGLGVYGGEFPWGISLSCDAGICQMEARTTYVLFPKKKTLGAAIRMAGGFEYRRFFAELALEVCDQRLGFDPRISDLDPEDKKTKWKKDNEGLDGYALSFGYRF